MSVTTFFREIWVAGGVVLLAASSLLASDPIQVGQPFPELLLPDAETGEPVSVSDFHGQKLVLHVWASW